MPQPLFFDYQNVAMVDRGALLPQARSDFVLLLGEHYWRLRARLFWTYCLVRVIACLQCLGLALVLVLVKLL
jgi:hypothetical protein